MNYSFCPSCFAIGFHPSKPWAPSRLGNGQKARPTGCELPCFRFAAGRDPEEWGM